MAEAQQGDTVKVHYTGTLTDGTVFDSSQSRDPLQFTVGSGEVISGFDNGVQGMEVGESKTVTVVADQAYGPHRGELLVELDRQQIPSNIDLEVGQQLQIAREDGQTFAVRVTGLSENSVTLDANHPLAGQDLTFEIQLLDIM